MIKSYQINYGYKIMDYKKNLRYFQNKKLMLYGSAALLAVGALLWVLPRNADNRFVMYILSVILILVGGAALIITVTSRSGDKKIDEDVQDAFKLFEEETLERYDLYERQLPYVESAVLEGYKYFEGSYLRRDKQGKYRTEIYAKTHVYFVPENLCIGAYEISLIEDKKEDRSAAVPYSDIEKSYLTDDRITYKKGKKNIEVKFQTLHIKKKDGQELTYQAYSSEALDRLCEDINHIVKRTGQ